MSKDPEYRKAKLAVGICIIWLLLTYSTLANPQDQNETMLDGQTDLAGSSHIPNPVFSYDSSGSFGQKTTDDLKHALESYTAFDLELVNLGITFTLQPEKSPNSDECADESRSANVQMFLITSDTYQAHGHAYLWTPPGATQSAMFVQVFGPTIIYGNGQSFRLTVTNYKSQLGPQGAGSAFHVDDVGVNNQIVGNQPISYPQSTTNPAGTDQHEFRLVRMHLIYDKGDVDYYCRILGAVDILSRSQIQTAFVLEDLELVDVQLNGFNGYAPCDSTNPASLMSSVVAYKQNQHTVWNNLRGAQNSNHYEDVDMLFYLADPLDPLPAPWYSSVSQLGCARVPTHADEGIGEGWIRIDDNLQDFMQNVNLVSHEFGHALGAPHPPCTRAPFNDIDDATEEVDPQQCPPQDYYGNTGSYLPAGNVMCRINLTHGYSYTYIMQPGLLDEDCYGPVPQFHPTPTVWYIQNRGHSGIPFEFIQPDWITANRRTSDDFVAHLWYAQVFRAANGPNSNPPVFDDPNWRIFYELEYDGTANFDAWEWFVGVRSDWGTTTSHRDAWLGYAGTRYTWAGSATVLKQGDVILFDSGWGENFYGRRTNLATGPVIFGGHDQICSLTTDCPEQHQHSLSTGSPPYTWVAWPAYHSQPATMSGYYGPYAWIAISWDQQS